MAVKTIEEYLESINDDGKKYVIQFIDFMQQEFPNLNSKISFSMPMWLVKNKMNEGYVAISTAKKHCSIHFSNEEYVLLLKKELKTCKAGKRCINIVYGDDTSFQSVLNSVKRFLNQVI